MRLKGKYKRHWYLLPEGYDLRKDKDTKSGYVIHRRFMKRYAWHPERNDLFYEPTTKTIYKYMDWNRLSPSGMCNLDGFAKIRKLSGGKSLYVDNIEVRKCIPITKIN